MTTTGVTKRMPGNCRSTDTPAPLSLAYISLRTTFTHYKIHTMSYSSVKTTIQSISYLTGLSLCTDTIFLKYTMIQLPDIDVYLKY